MNPERSNKEIVTLVLAQMEDWIAYGFSPTESARIIAKITGCNSDKLMDIWLDRKVLEHRHAQQMEFEFDG